MTSKRFIKQVLLSSFVASVTLSSTAAFADKIGVVNLQRALQECKRGKAAKAALEKEVEDKKKKIDGERSSIQKATEEFQKKSAVLSEKVKTEKGVELQGRMQAFQELVQKSQAELQGREQELTKPILESLKTLIGTIAKKDGVKAVFEESTSGLLFAEEKVDLTEKLIKAYDAKQ